MRKILHEMIVNIHQVENTIIGSVDNLNLIMQENSSRSEDNSAATQEIAAGMQVASSNTASIVESIDEVKRNSQSIYELAQNGEKNSEQILVRAEAMEKVSKESSNKTNSIFEAMKQKTEIAIEQSKAVARINELTDDINHTVCESADGINVIAEKSTEAVCSTMEGYERLRESRQSVEELKEIVDKFKL